MKRFIQVILVVLCLILVFAIAYEFYKEKRERDDLVKRDEELLAELEELKTKKEIIEKCIERDEKNQKILQEKANRWYRLLVSGAITIGLILMGIIYLVVPATELATWLLWRDFALIIVALFNGLIIVTLNLEKKGIKNSVKGIIESVIFKKRDVEYYLKRKNINQNEIDEIKKRMDEIRDERIHNKLSKL